MRRGGRRFIVRPRRGRGKMGGQRGPQAIGKKTKALFFEEEEKEKKREPGADEVWKVLSPKQQREKKKRRKRVKLKKTGSGPREKKGNPNAT